MKKVKTVVVENGYIKGFDQALIDPMMTNQKVEKLLIETDEFILFEKKRDEYTKVFLEQNHIENMSGEKSEKLKKDIEEKFPELQTLEIEVNEISKQVGKKVTELRENNLTYFEPKIGEKIITEEEYIDLSGKMKNRKPFEQVKENGEIEVDEKLKEQQRQSLINQALSQAANMKSTLEIQKDPDALEKSQDWFEVKKTEIEKGFNNA